MWTRQALWFWCLWSPYPQTSFVYSLYLFSFTCTFYSSTRYYFTTIWKTSLKLYVYIGVFTILNWKMSQTRPNKSDLARPNNSLVVDKILGNKKVRDIWKFGHTRSKSILNLWWRVDILSVLFYLIFIQSTLITWKLFYFFKIVLMYLMIIYFVAFTSYYDTKNIVVYWSGHSYSTSNSDVQTLLWMLILLLCEYFIHRGDWCIIFDSIELII